MQFIFEPCINVSYCVIIILSNESGHMPTQMPLTFPVLTIKPNFIKQICFRRLRVLLGYFSRTGHNTNIRLCCVQYEKEILLYAKPTLFMASFQEPLEQQNKFVYYIAFQKLRCVMSVLVNVNQAFNVNSELDTTHNRQLTCCIQFVDYCWESYIYVVILKW